MGRKPTTLAILGLVCIMAVHAGGRKDNESHEADNTDGFTSSIPIENKKTGKWNFFIQAKDKGGNTTIAGAHNIYNDPASDLPIATIINPRRNMHVQGNLNIVGMAIDDDGVDHVEFVITRGADGKGEELVRGRAEGKNFWSYLLDTTNEEIWPDGVYTISAWAVDINGLEGISTDFPAKVRKFHQVSWNLDRKKPETKITSHGPGALVSGNINLKGTVLDGNGVDSLRYSLDEGVTYRAIPIKGDKKGNSATWELKLNTLNMEDGPAVIWFQARDGMGTLGVAAHLLFINNTQPEIQILHPGPDAVVGGVFTVAVYANHPVGLKSVTWKLDRDSGEFPMVIGNPWWIQEFDIRGKKTSAIDLEIRAEDLSGNYTIAKRRYKVDPNAGMLKVNLETPAANAVINDNILYIKGSIITGQNETAASILYSLNSEPAVEIPCTGFFQLAVPDIPAGTHTLDVWAKDIMGTEGPKVQIRGIVNPGQLPELKIESVTIPSSGRIQRNFYTGMDINPEPRMVMDFAINSAHLIASASVRFNDRAPVSLSPRANKEGVFHVDIPVPTDLGSGLIKVELRAVDRLGREGVKEELFYTNRTGIPDFQWVRPDLMSDGRILIRGSDDVLIGLGGVPIEDVQLIGSGAENLRATADEYGRVQLRAVREGSFGPLTLSMNNRRFTSEQFRVMADFAPPVINLEGSSSGWVQSQVQVQLRISEPNRLQSVEISTDLGDSWQTFLSSSEISSLSSSTVINRNLGINLINDGTVTILIRAIDEVGHVAIKGFYVQKDNEAPLPQLIVPLVEASVNGTIRLGIAVQEAGTLKTVTYNRPAMGNRPAISWQVYPTPESEKISDPRFLNILMDSMAMPLDNNMSFAFEDMAGNRSVLNSWPFIIDNQMDIPIVHIILPLENEVITTGFEVSGVMFDDDAIKQIYWRIDNGREQVFEAENGFSVPIALSGLTDNEHTVTVVAEDIYGVKSAPVTRKFKVSLREPVATITTPSFDMISGGFVEMSGGSFDENGIDKVQISMDNGLTFNDARLNAYDNTAEWFYDFNSTILKDGPHVIFVRVQDKYEISAMYAGLLNIDNTPPEIVLGSPMDGTITSGLINILGEVVDVNLEEKTIELRSLQGVRIPSGYKIARVDQTPFLRETFDMGALPNGFYNIEIQAIDKAGNTSIISKNIELSREKQQNFVDILYPLNGEHLQGNFNLYGKTGGSEMAQSVTLRVNNHDVITSDVTWTGHYAFALNEEHLSPGINQIIVYSDFGGEKDVLSEIRTLHYEPSGPWVTIDSLTMGDFAYERPWLSGRAGYSLSEEDLEILADKKGDKEQRDEVLAKTLDSIDISFDNGSTFSKTGRGRDKNFNWSYRLETGEMAEGTHYILVRATMKNGDVAVTRTRVQVDKTPPRIRLIAPEPGGHYNTDLEFAAMASDDVELASLSYHLRVGDKLLYEVPGFLQGLYFEATIPPFVRQVAKKAPAIFAGGATYMDIGVGLSFFDDNVKVQVQYGFLTQKLYESLGGEGPVRYGGHVMAFKLLANVYSLPFGRVAGPDWEWLSADFALGANFSLFDLARQGYTQSGEPTWMSALLLQMEFPKVTIPKREKLRTFSFFTEGQLWFVPTDVPASKFGIRVIIPHVILGLRMYIF
jgi:hypothetical protein